MTKIRNEAYIKAFGERVRSLREKKELSQYQLAFEANVDRSQIIKIENGEINTTISTLYALAKAFEITPSQILEFRFNEKSPS